MPMNVEATQPSPLERRPIDVDDYRRMAELGILAPDERVELIEGEIVTMPPIAGDHVDVVNELNARLVLAVGRQAIVSVQNPMILSDLSMPEPDLVLLRARCGTGRRGVPELDEVLLAIEVADSTLRRDTVVKMPLYARHGVPEAWLADVPGERLVRHRDPVDGAYRDVAVPDDLSVVPLPGLEGVAIDLSALFD